MQLGDCKQFFLSVAKIDEIAQSRGQVARFTGKKARRAAEGANSRL
jgi:hypothetical protein